MIRIVIRDEFMRHTELHNSDKLNAVEKDYLQKMQNSSLSDHGASEIVKYGIAFAGKHVEIVTE